MNRRDTQPPTEKKTSTKSTTNTIVVPHSTNKSDLVHYFFSAHGQKVKSVIIIGFFLRAIRICSEVFLQAKVDFIVESFLELRYPLALLISLKEKAKSIMNKRDTQPPSEKTSTKSTTIVVPHSAPSETVKTLLSPSLAVVTTAGKRLGELLKQKKKNEKNTKSVVYKIPCGGCSRVYYGEIGRGLMTHVREHKADLRYHRPSSGFVVAWQDNHADDKGHLPNWSGAASLDRNFTKGQRKIVEAAFISSGNTLNASPGFFRLSSFAATLIRRKYPSL